MCLQYPPSGFFMSPREGEQHPKGLDLDIPRGQSLRRETHPTDKPIPSQQPTCALNAIDDIDSFLQVNATFVDNHADSEGDRYYSYITGGSPTTPNTGIANTIFWGSDEQIASSREKPIISSCDIQPCFFG